MSFSRSVLVSDIPENLEIAEGIALTFRKGDAGDLSRGLSAMLDMEAAERERMGAMGRDRVARAYTWDHVTDEIEALYRRLANGVARSN
jgi:glycosyltransferase involved in cell wall biosynthesis